MILESLPSRNSSVTRRLFGVRGSRGRRSPMPCAFSSPEARTWENDIDRGTSRRSGVKGGKEEEEEESRTIYHRARNRARIFQ